MQMALGKLIERGKTRKTSLRDDPETDIVRTTVNLQRTPGGSITIWVEAPDGVAGGIDLDALDHRNPNARGIVSWAKEQLGRNKAKRGASVELEPRNEGTFLAVKSRRYSGRLNLDEIEVDARVLRWAKASLRPPKRKRRPVKEWA
jgi:hypothetical protein